jgi:histidyl-tRNA synthetase
LVAEAPVLIDHLCDDCVDNFESVKNHLASLGVSYTTDPQMVRGLD